VTSLGALCVTLSALLLFQLEPLIAKRALPLFGGSPAVWTTALVFFQVLLVIGYGYSHFVVKRLAPRRQLVLHALVLLLPLLAMPPRIGAGAAPPPGGWPVPALLWALFCSVGLPFFALSATNSLVQAWLARATGRDPSALYAWSNAGSLLALLTYPFLVEPFVGLGHQAIFWSAGYGLFALLLILLMLRTLRMDTAAPAAAETAARFRASPRQIAGWVFRAFLPSLLLSAVSLTIATDVAAVPLLWVVPLALYLVTFILAFAPRLPYPRRALLILAQAGIVAAAMVKAQGSIRLVVALGVPLWVLFTGSLVCHFDLSRDRPPPEGLTSYYLWIAIGGAAGGLFGNVAAPLVFERVHEYPIALVLLGLATVLEKETRQVLRDSLRWPTTFILLGILLAALTAWTVVAWGRTNWPSPQFPVIPLALFAASIFLFRWPLIFPLVGLTVVTMAFSPLYWAGTVREARRSFFGTVRINDYPNGYRSMVHGTTGHGLQRLDKPEAPPATYYHPRTPLGQLVGQTGAEQRIAVIGLGTGCIAALAKPGQEVVYYEIDRLIEELARRWFTYLPRSKGKVTVRLGDARLVLAEAAPAAYALIVVDAFSSDAIPVHLLTEEALRLYLDKSDPHAVIALHISNRYVDLVPVLRAAARRLGLGGAQLIYRPDDEAEAEGAYASDVVALSRDPARIEALVAAGWQKLEGGPEVVWTDDRSSLLPVLHWRKR
jgi:hypothetical protein